MKHLTFLALAFNLFTYASFAQSSSNSDTQPGTLDKSFGDSGIVITVVSPGGFNNNVCNAVALQKDNKIVAAGSGGYDGKGSYFLMRYNDDGSIDSSFGDNGKTITSTPDYGEEIYTAIVLEDGKILTAGGCSGCSHVIVIRYLTDGTVDSTFGMNGLVRTALSENKNVDLHRPMMALDKENRIIVAGKYQSNENDNKRAYIIRYTPDGMLDESFASKGFNIITFDNLVKVGAVDVQDDNKILIGGEYAFLSIQPSYFLARYLPDGTPDTDFGTNGVATESFTGYDSKLFSIALQSDGKILAGGTGGDDKGYGFGIMRFDIDGKLDESFGTGGKVATVFDTSLSEVRKLLIQPDGKIVAAGSEFAKIFYTHGKFALARYLPNGILDESFGNGGTQVTLFSDYNARGYGAALQQDGKILMGGLSSIYDPFENDFALARYIGGDGVLPITYNYINASKYNNTILLSWQTAEENNNSFFAVEHATGNTSFTEIARVASNDNGKAQQYAYADKTPVDGNNFYRLKQVNADGNYSFSKTVSVYFSADGSIKLHPNPANSEIILEGLDAAVASTISIAGADGKTVVQKNIQSGSYIFDVKNLRAGVYFVKVQNKNQTSVLKFVKQ